MFDQLFGEYPPIIITDQARIVNVKCDLANYVSVIDISIYGCILMDMEINENILYKSIGKQLKNRRIERKLTQDELSQKVGVKRTSITNIEKGIQKLPLHLLYRICAILEIEARELLPTTKSVALSKTELFVKKAKKDLEDWEE